MRITLFDPTINGLSIASSYLMARHTLIANNIANVNTPHYKAKDLNNTLFVRKLEEVFNDNTWNTLEFNPNNYIMETPYTGAFRLDGNNVNLESESIKLIKNSLMHNATIRILNYKFNMLKDALSERIR